MMTLVLACVPGWYCARYVREEVSFFSSFLALVQWMARIALLPLNITWAEVTKLDTRLYELGAIVSEVSFLAWVWGGTQHPHQSLIRTMPEWAWTLLMLPLAIGHIDAFARREPHARIIALIIDLVLYSWLLLNALKGKFYFAEVFLWAFFAMGVIAVFSLHALGDRDGAK